MNRILRLLLTLGVVSLLGTSTRAPRPPRRSTGPSSTRAARAAGRHRHCASTDTGFRREAVTDETGSYALLNLPIGPYRLEATLSGFRTYAQTGIVLQVNSNPRDPGHAAAGQRSRKRCRSKRRRRSSRRAIPRSARSSTTSRSRRCRSKAATRRRSSCWPAAPSTPGKPSSRSMTQSRGIAIAGGQPFGVAYLLDGAMHNNVLRRREPAAAVSRRAAGVPRRDQLAERAERRQGGRHGQRGDQVGHQPVPRRRCSSSRATTASTRPARLRRSIRRPASAPTTAWCATSSAARSAGRSSRTGSSSSARIRARARRRRRPTSSRSFRRRRCWPATSRPSPRRSAARRATSRCRRRSGS